MSNDPQLINVSESNATGRGRKLNDFHQRTINLLAKRVGFVCSNPDCRRPTSGPHTSQDRAINIGVAAHITAAAANGPRFDLSMTTEQRKDVSNGIWLCQSCSRLIDTDNLRFTVTLLQKWKVDAESRALSLVEQNLRGGFTRMLPDELKPVISLELTTPPSITRNIARSPDGQFWLVSWNTIDATYHWSKVTDEYAIEQLEPVRRFRNLSSWEDLFDF